MNNPFRILVDGDFYAATENCTVVTSSEEIEITNPHDVVRSHICGPRRTSVTGTFIRIGDGMRVNIHKSICNFKWITDKDGLYLDIQDAAN